LYQQSKEIAYYLLMQLSLRSKSESAGQLEKSTPPPPPPALLLLPPPEALAPALLCLMEVMSLLAIWRAGVEDVMNELT
jgi:hypothetical protein